MTEIQINYLTRKLAESGLYMANSRDDSMFDGNTDESLNELEAILVIKQLQEKVFLLFIAFSGGFWSHRHTHWEYATFDVAVFSFCLFPFSQITMLEIEKSSSQQNLDGVVELITKQQICAKEKFEEVMIV